MNCFALFKDLILCYSSRPTLTLFKPWLFCVLDQRAVPWVEGIPVVAAEDIHALSHAPGLPSCALFCASATSDSCCTHCPGRHRPYKCCHRTIMVPYELFTKSRQLSRLCTSCKDGSVPSLSPLPCLQIFRKHLETTEHVCELWRHKTMVVCVLRWS